MRPIALVVVLLGTLTACENAGGPSLQGPLTPPIDLTTGPGPAGLPVCQALARAMDSLEACAPTPRDKEVLAWLNRDLRRDVTDAQRDAAGWAETCLDLLAGFVTGHEHGPVACQFGLSATERAWVDGYARPRAYVPDAVTGRDRARLLELVGLRDRACGCFTTPCRDAIDAALDAPPRDGRIVDRVAADVAGALLTEISRCGRRVPRVVTPSELARDPAPPALPALPAPPPPAPATTTTTRPRPNTPRTVTLPDGQRLTHARCSAIVDEFDRENCLQLFVDVGDCRGRTSTVEAETCERRVLADYAEANLPTTPTDFEDDDDD